MNRIVQSSRNAAARTASITVLVLVVCALGAIVSTTDTAHARAADCPSSWPDAEGEQFFTDSAGAEWFVIRSADSNGYETVRAYPADDGYSMGYIPGSPDEICNLLVRRPESAADLDEPRRVIFRAEREPKPREVVTKTLFREFYDRLIPNGPQGPNPDPKWGGLFDLFTNEERSCMSAALGDERLAMALQNSVFHEGDPRLEDMTILACLSEDTGGALTFAITFAAFVRQVEASGEENPCVQELLEPAVEALSKPNPTEDELLAVFEFFFGLVSCGLDMTDTPAGSSGG